VNLRQPVLGIAASVFIIIVSMVVISLFDFPTFAGWVSYGLICIIPMEIVIGITWGTNHPRFAASQAQPVRGMLLVLTTFVVGVIVGVVHFYTVGGGVSPPNPVVIQCLIVSVVVAFWLVVMWGGWPFSLIKSPLASGLVLLVACYVVNYALFQVLFNYAFLEGAPVYVPALDPGGLFNGGNMVVFYVTFIAIMFLFLHFDLWPLTTNPAIMKQPVLGIVWTLIALVLGGALYYAGVVVAGMDAQAFMVTVPIPFIFGTIIVLNMMHNSIFGGLKQPARGVANTVAAMVVGSVLAVVYGSLSGTLTGPLAEGPPAYEYEIWLASALLAVTFPFLIFFAEFFKMWPMMKPAGEKGKK
jgi:hypothetical protein